jgi:galactokinase
MNNSKIISSAPGRICLFGEHQDYLGLPVIAAAISLRISIEGEITNKKLIHINLPDVNTEESFNVNEVIRYEKERDYFKSCIKILQRKGFTFSKGIDCSVRGEIPINAGTSSSSALVVSWINFLVKVSDQNKRLTDKEIAELAYEAEVLEFSEPGGMMDHYSTALGGVIYLESFPKIIVHKIEPLPGFFVLGNSGEPKDTKTILKRVKFQVLDIIKDLRKKYSDFSLQECRLEDIEIYSRELNNDQEELLAATIKNRDITQLAKKVLKASKVDQNKIGILINQHQAILREFLNISTIKIDKMINAALEAGALGAKINGSGGGGCMFAYAPSDYEEVGNAIERAGGKSYIVKIDSGVEFK